MDDQALCADVGGAQADIEADAGVAEGVVPDGGLVLGNGVIDLLHHLPADLDGDPLDVLEVALIADPARDGHGYLVLGQVVVGDDGGCHRSVRDNEDVVRELADNRVAPVRILDVSLHPVVKLDEVARLYLARGEDVDTGEQVAQRVLQGEGNRQAANAQGGEQRRNGHSKAVEQDQSTDRPYDHPGDAHEDARRPRGARVGRRPGMYGRPGHLCAAQGDDHHDDREQRVVEVIVVGAAQRQGQDRGPYTANPQAPGGDQAQERNNDVTAAPAGPLCLEVQAGKEDPERESTDDSRCEVGGRHDPGVRADRPCHPLSLRVRWRWAGSEHRGYWLTMPLNGHNDELGAGEGSSRHLPRGHSADLKSKCADLKANLRSKPKGA
jgi:hypothetical protein